MRDPAAPRPSTLDSKRSSLRYRRMYGGRVCVMRECIVHMRLVGRCVYLVVLTAPRHFGGNLSIKVNGRQSGEHHERHRRHRTKTWGAVLLAVVWRAYHASRRHSNAQANFACAHIRLLWDVDKCVSDYLLPTTSFSTRLCAQSKREGS